MQTLIAVNAQVAPCLLHCRCLAGKCIASLLNLSIDRCRQRIVNHLRIVAHVADAFGSGLQLLDGDAQLTVINQPGTLIQILMKQGDVSGVGGKFNGILLLRKQFSSTDNLDRLSLGSYESHQRLRHLGSTSTHSLSLVTTCQIVHFQQHQSCIASGDAFVLAVLLFQSEADARQRLRPSVVTFQRSVVRAQGVSHQRIDISELADLQLIVALPNHFCYFLMLHQSQRLLIPVVLDNSTSCSHFLSIL